MSLGKTFTSSIVREVGRNYGKAISNSLLGNSHSTPIRVTGSLGSGTGGRNYRHKLDKLCKTLEIKGHKATFWFIERIAVILNIN